MSDLLSQTPSPITVAISPCPNDTFIFHGLASGRLSLENRVFSFVFEDVETLNRAALSGQYDVTKLSFHAFLLVRDRYRLLRAGAALGYGCGPILVSKRPITPDELDQLHILVPGALTTAHLLLRLYRPSITNKQFVRYDEIIPMLLEGKADAGVIIHEDRFVFEAMGLRQVVDLGAFWEEKTHTPIPLGCIAVRRDLAPLIAADLDSLIRRSIEMAQNDIDHALPFIRTHAQQMDAEVLEKHITTFVNDQSLDLGVAGEQAVAALENLAREAGIVP